jgi:hypothetical protein
MIYTFLQVPQGKPTHNLVKREGLGFECLVKRIHKASKEQIAITKLDVPVKQMLPKWRSAAGTAIFGCDRNHSAY